MEPDPLNGAFSDAMLRLSARISCHNSKPPSAETETRDGDLRNARDDIDLLRELRLRWVVTVGNQQFPSVRHPRDKGPARMRMRQRRDRPFETALRIQQYAVFPIASEGSSRTNASFLPSGAHSGHRSTAGSRISRSGAF